ncbi:unnamed protein product [Leptosia nina]|uniref:Glycine-rich protein n=1 Tax=Leptosia nina TaxID=320188 RepID=A0AAV1JDV2_9NEOP
MKLLIVLTVLSCIATLKAQPFMGSLGADLGANIGAEIGAGVSNIIRSSMNMALNGVGAMNTGLLDAEDGVGYGINGGLENGLGFGMGRSGLGMGVDDYDAGLEDGDII